MNNEHGDLISTTLSSHRADITGHYFFDSIKKAWFEILESSFVYVAFEYAFGERWNKNYHLIVKAEKCDAKKAKHIEACSKKEFSELVV